MANCLPYGRDVVADYVPLLDQWKSRTPQTYIYGPKSTSLSLSLSLSLFSLSLFTGSQPVQSCWTSGPPSTSIINIIIIKSRCYHGFPGLSLSLSLNPCVSVIHPSWLIFQTKSFVRTELMLTSSCWSAHTGTSMCRGP